MQPKHQGTENAGEMVYVKLSDTLSGCIKCSSPNRGWHDNQRLPGELLFLFIAHDDGLYPRYSNIRRRPNNSCADFGGWCHFLS